MSDLLYITRWCITTYFLGVDIFLVMFTRHLITDPPYVLRPVDVDLHVPRVP